MIVSSGKALLMGAMIIALAVAMTLSGWLEQVEPGSEDAATPAVNLSDAGATGLPLNIPDAFAAKFPHAVREFEATVAAADVGTTFSLRLMEQPDSAAVGRVANPESYTISVSSASVEIIGAADLGLLHGMTDMQNRLSSGFALAPGRTEHKPWLATRGAHVVLRGLDAAAVQDVITRARRARMNTIVLQVADGVHLQSIPRIARRDALTKQDVRELLVFASDNGMTIIPELKLLTHQGKFLKKEYPHLMFNSETYDPRKEEVYGLVFDVIDEVLELFDASALHVGHDEVFGHGGGGGTGEEVLPPHLFLKDVLRLHDYLTERNVTAWMWGDMLINPREFPVMASRHLHGSDDYAALRSQIPRDIVVCDWHYSDRGTRFPSAAAFAELGHRVVGATWKKPVTIRNFSRFISELPRGGEGMLATTWFHVQRSDEDILDRIFDESGKSFWGPN